MIVAICDDDSAICNQVADLTRNYARRHGLAMSCRPFQRPEDILDSEVESFSIIFLDIDFPGGNGLALAWELFRRGCGAPIVFLTSRGQDMEMSRKTHAFRFVSKALLHLQFDTLVYDTVNEYLLRNYELPFGRYRIPLFDLMYLESDLRMIIAHLHRDGKLVRAYGSLDFLERRLEDKSFLRIHSGLLINMRYVDTVQQNAFYVGGKPLFSSRRYLVSARQKYQEWLSDY